MTPAAFRRLPKSEQVEMIAHRRESNLRNAHLDHVREMVSKMEDPTEPKNKSREKSRL